MLLLLDSVTVPLLSSRGLHQLICKTCVANVRMMTFGVGRIVLEALQHVALHCTVAAPITHDSVSNAIIIISRQLFVTPCDLKRVI